MVENNEEKSSQESNMDEESCDCWDKIEILVENANVLNDEIKKIFY